MTETKESVLTVKHPAIRYHGGKFRLASWIIEQMPEHVCYVEPFGGAAGESLSTTQLTRNVVKASGSKQYAIGLQQVSIGSDPLLVAIESYYRKDTDTLTENLIAGALDFISGNLDQSTTLITSYGLAVSRGLTIADVLPASVLAADGQTTSATTAGASSSTASAS